MSGGPAKPAIVLFDWDNTLVDTWDTIYESLKATMEAMGLEPWTREQTEARVRQSLREAFPRMFGDRWEEARSVFFDAFESIHIERLKPLDDADALLSALAEAGVGMGIVSNKTSRYLRAEATHLGWLDYFQSIVGAGDTARDKPAPDALLAALAPMQAEPGPDIWVVGDADVDMEIAHRTGCVPILMHSDSAAQEFDKWRPAHCFPSCGGLLEYIAGW